MSKTFFFALIFTLSGLACEKTSSDTCEPSSIIGKWKLTEMRYDPGNGSGGSWTPAPPDHYVQFKSDLSMTPDPSVLKGFVQYEVVDSSKIKFADANGNIRNGGYTLCGNELEIRPGYCFEGCWFRFVRQ